MQADDRLRKRARHLVATRRVFPVLALLTAAFAVGVGILVRFIDHKDFHTVGDGVWWAVVTLGTVGYGDIVPHSAWGRLIGVIVIVFGITFLSFTMATVTSLFVASDQEASNAVAEERRAASENETRALLQQILERLNTLENKEGDRVDE
jgi:voltage-gated potassium channel Kch